MRPQAFLLFAAVSLSIGTTAQQTHYFPRLSLEKKYDVTYINNSNVHQVKSTEKQKLKLAPSSHQLAPRLDFSSLQNNLRMDMQYLKSEQRGQQWQGLFQGALKEAAYRKQ